MSQMRVPLLDLKPSFSQSLREVILAEFAAITDEQGFILGPRVQALEAELAAFAGVPHVLGASSGTDAQLLLMMGLGLGPGDAVLTTPYTFFATAGCVHRLGARPVFADIDPATFNLDPAAVDRYLRETARRDGEGRLCTPAGEVLRAIIPVHLYGQCADLDAFRALGQEFGLAVLEDAAQALGADFVDAAGHAGKAGALADGGWYSFYPTKNLGAFGDAGALTCPDPALAERLTGLRNHGQSARQYLHELVGGNFRLDALQAAVLRAKLPLLPGWCDARREVAARYREGFAAAGLEWADRVTPPAAVWAQREKTVPGARTHIYNQFIIRVPAEKRDPLRQHLAEREIGTNIYYPLPLHQQPCFAYLSHQAGDFPESERAAQESIALPIYPGLAEDQVAWVVESIAAFFA